MWKEIKICHSFESFINLPPFLKYLELCITKRKRRNISRFFNFQYALEILLIIHCFSHSIYFKIKSITPIMVFSFPLQGGPTNNGRTPIYGYPSRFKKTARTRKFKFLGGYLFYWNSIIQDDSKRRYCVILYFFLNGNVPVSLYFIYMFLLNWV